MARRARRGCACGRQCRGCRNAPDGMRTREAAEVRAWDESTQRLGEFEALLDASSLGGEDGRPLGVYEDGEPLLVTVSPDGTIWSGRTRSGKTYTGSARGAGFDALLAASSLGGEGGEALAARTSDETVAAILRKAASAPSSGEDPR